MSKVKPIITIVILLAGLVSGGLIGSIQANDGIHHTLRYLTTSGYPQSMRKITFAPDSSQLAFAVAGKLDFIDPRLGRITGQHEASPFSLAYTRDGSRIYMISEYESSLLDTLTGAKLGVRFDRTPGYIGLSIVEQSGKLLIQSLANGGPASKSDGLQIGDEIVGCAEGRNGYMIDVRGKRKQDFIELLKGTAGTYLQLKVLPKGRFGEDSTRIHTLRRVPGDSNGNSIAFKPLQPAAINNNLAWCIADGKHEFRSAATGLPIAQFESIDVDNVGLYALSPDQTKFAIVARQKSNSNSNAVEVFDIATQDRLAFIPMAMDSFYDIAFCADNNRILVATYDTVEVCDVTKSKLVDRLTLGWIPPEKVEKERGGSGIAATVINAAWDELAFIERDEKRAPRQLVSKMAVSSRGVVATGDRSGMVKLWDLNSGVLLQEMPPNPEEEIEALLFSPNGKWLVFFIEGVLHITDVSAVQSLTAEQLARRKLASSQQSGPKAMEVPAITASEVIPGLGITGAEPNTASTFKLAKGTKIEVRSRGRWYPATLFRDDGGGRWEVHYDDSPEDWNELTTQSRIRPRE